MLCESTTRRDCSRAGVRTPIPEAVFQRRFIHSGTTHPDSRQVVHKFIAKNLNSWVEDSRVRPFAVYRVSVTEIPEHLLQRSRERRAALSGSDASPSAPAETTSSSSAPVPAEAAAPSGPAPEQLHQKPLRLLLRSQIPSSSQNIAHERRFRVGRWQGSPFFRFGCLCMSVR